MNTRRGYRLGFGAALLALALPLADGRVLRATIASPVFVDPEGARQNV